MSDLPPLPDPAYIYHPESGVGTDEYVSDDLYDFTVSGAVDEGCDRCVRLYTKEQMLAYAVKVLAERGRMQGDIDAITHLNHKKWIALENVRTLANRNRDEPWAQHLLRWCEEAGNTAQCLRAHPPAQAAQGDALNAKRYRWLRANWHQGPRHSTVRETTASDELDAAIDAAMAAPEGEK